MYKVLCMSNEVSKLSFKFIIYLKSYHVIKILNYDVYLTTTTTTTHFSSNEFQMGDLSFFQLI